MILFGIWLSFLLVSGVRWRHLLAALLIFALIAAAAWIYFLKDYQKNAFSAYFFPSAIRWESITTLFNQKSPSVRRGFSARDSDRGHEAQLGFLPEAQTDFIFAAFVEEWGMLGGLLVVGAFLLLIARIVGIGFKSVNNFGAFACLGNGRDVRFAFLFNVGSNLGFFSGRRRAVSVFQLRRVKFFDERPAYRYHSAD